jgi:multimeric flavodoxin WrbA
MKAILINGSPRKNGNSNFVAERFAARLAGHGIDSEVLQIGSMDMKGCKGCWACADNTGCVQKDDVFSEAAAECAAKSEPQVSC